MFDYIDRLFGIVRPRKLLYMAIGKPRLALTSLACLTLESSHEYSESKAHAHHRKLRIQSGTYLCRVQEQARPAHGPTL